MLYAFISQDIAGSLDKRLAARPGHVKRLEQLCEEWRSILAGSDPALDCEDPGPAGFTGSLIVAEFDSLKEAQEWAKSDPYVTAGIYERVTVKPFKRTLP